MCAYIVYACAYRYTQYMGTRIGPAGHRPNVQVVGAVKFRF